MSSYLREIAWRQRYPNGNQVFIHNVGVYPALSGKKRSLDSHNLGILPDNFFRKCKRFIVSNILFLMRGKIRRQNIHERILGRLKVETAFYSLPRVSWIQNESKRAGFHSRPHQCDFGSHCWPILLAIIGSAAPKANFNFEYHSCQRSTLLRARLVAGVRKFLNLQNGCAKSLFGCFAHDLIRLRFYKRNDPEQSEQEQSG